VNEWIKIDMDVNDFKRSSLSEVGTLIKFQSGEVYLIGDINANFGVCDCCRGYSSGDRVVEYKVVLEDWK